MLFRSRNPSNKLQVELEKCMMITAYQIRKLIEARKVSDSVKNARIPVIEYYENIKIVTFLNWHRLDELYDFSKNRESTLTIKTVCNLLIHSYIFMPLTSSASSPFNGMFFSSDKTRNSKLYYISLKDWINYLEIIGVDYPNDASMVFDKKKNDYNVPRAMKHGVVIGTVSINDNKDK